MLFLTVTCQFYSFWRAILTAQRHDIILRTSGLPFMAGHLVPFMSKIMPDPPYISFLSEVPPCCWGLSLAKKVTTHLPVEYVWEMLGHHIRALQNIGDLEQ